jgi:3-methyladenine DNA glycosylase AlkD
MVEKLIFDLRRAIENTTGRSHPVADRRFHKHNEYLSYGLKTADFRQILKAFRPRLLKVALKERLDAAAHLIGKHVGEFGHIGIHLVALSLNELKPYHFPSLDRLLDDFRSWSHVDHFCFEVMQPLLWKYRDETLALVKEWNRAPVRWKRRASVVIFTRKVGESGEFTDEALRLCENLIWDKEDIVRKGVGWALKDNIRSAQKAVLPFIKDLRRQGVSSTITLYAIRDLKGAERNEVLSIKKRA